jgi:hypothetical protein
MNNSIPTVSIKDLQNITDEVSKNLKIKYLKGHPRQYRFDASRGIFNIDGEIPVTKTGKPLTLIPISYRVFKDSLFGTSKRSWLELFFIDDIGAIASVLLHGYSVEHFFNMTQKLFYEDLKITEIKITITPQEKQTAKGEKYFIAEFEHEAADPEYLKVVQANLEGVELYREDTIQPTNTMILWENYPLCIVESEKLEAKAKAEVVAEAAIVESEELKKAA